MDNVILIFITLMASTVSIICIRYNIRLRNYLKVFIETSKQISNREFHSRLNIDARGELGCRGAKADLEECEYLVFTLAALSEIVAWNGLGVLERIYRGRCYG